MNDTPDFIARKQVEIVLSKPISQRLQLLNDTIQHGRQLARSRLLAHNPALSETEIKFLLISEYYGDVLTANQLAAIKQQLSQPCS